MKFESILAVSDFSAQSVHVLERAALLARQHQVALRLVHLAEGPRTFSIDPVARMGLRARQLARRHEIVVHAMGQSASLNDVLAEAGASSLLVMGPLSQRHWRQFHRGTALDRAVFGSTCPLLIVRQAASKPYGCVLVTIDLTPGSMLLIDFADRFSTPAVLKLFHAIDTIKDSKLRSVSVSPEAIQANRLGSRWHARERLMQIVTTLDGAVPGRQRHPLAFDFGHGDPAESSARHQRSTQADLIVVGQRRCWPLAQFFTRSVAQRLARWAAGDVLVAPLDSLSPATGAPTLI